MWSIRREACENTHIEQLEWTLPKIILWSFMRNGSEKENFVPDNSRTHHPYVIQWKIVDG
jgi:hypothetical protein